MDIFHLDKVSFTYPDAKEKALSNINLHIKKGEFTVIAGPSGCGKTSLLRLLKRELAPVGDQEGTIYYNGQPLEKFDERTLIEEIGFVFQNPDNQIVMDEVMQEIVFGMENLGYSTLEMRKRVAELVHFFGLDNLLYEKPSKLSGGQKQMVNLLSVLLLKPKVLLLDEPTSQLDPVAARELLSMLTRLNEEMGITIILVEHRLEQLYERADRIILMNHAQISYAGRSEDLIQEVYERGDDSFIPYIPSITRLFLERQGPSPVKKLPLTVKDSRSWISSLPEIPHDEEVSQAESPLSRDVILQAKNIFFQYDRKGKLILNNFSLKVKEGDFFALVGGNGSGKTTALKICLGIVNQQRGSLRIFGKKLTKKESPALYKDIAYLPQNPQSYFSYDSIEEEMKAVMKQHGLSDGEVKITEMLHAFGIEHLRHRHPYDCSGGEMQKAALAAMLLKNPKLLIVDEPTKGFDNVSKKEFASLLEGLHEKGLTIVMVTHDIEFAAKYASRCAMLFEGEITALGTPDELFRGNYFYTTAINRATRDQRLPEALTLEEALLKWPSEVQELI